MASADDGKVESGDEDGKSANNRKDEAGNAGAWRKVFDPLTEPQDAEVKVAKREAEQEEAHLVIASNSEEEVIKQRRKKQATRRKTKR